MFHVPTVLFLGTTNVHRSRIAEALLNHHAQAGGIGWCAFSRGLATDRTELDGLAPQAREALEARGVDLQHSARQKTTLETKDLEMAHIIIAMSRKEHEPMITSQFPDWSGQVNFWNVDDDPEFPPEEAAARIEDEIQCLLEAICDSAQDS